MSKNTDKKNSNSNICINVGISIIFIKEDDFHLKDRIFEEEKVPKQRISREDDFSLEENKKEQVFQKDHLKKDV